MSPIKIYADFNNLDDFNRLRLTCAGTVEDLARLGITLNEGLSLTFFMDDADDQGQADELLVEGVVHYSEEDRNWVASVDWPTVYHASELNKSKVNGSNASTMAVGDKDRRI